MFIFSDIFCCRVTIMKKILILVICVLFLGSASAFGVPSLQLDIGNGFYNVSGDPKYDDETVLSNGKAFTLYALMKESNKTSLNDTYYISMALYPSEADNLGSLGSFYFEGIKIDVVDDMTYGNPGIPGHGVFPTYYKEWEFTFDGATVGEYNTQDNTGEFANFFPGTGLYYAAFDVDTTKLSDDFSIHFDLYNDRTNAPFSHDAQSDPPGTDDPVPEPSTMFLLGVGLISFAGVIKRKTKK